MKLQKLFDNYAGGELKKFETIPDGYNGTKSVYWYIDKLMDIKLKLLSLLMMQKQRNQEI